MGTSKRKDRAENGTVTIELRGKTYRLRWTFDGQKFSMSTRCRQRFEEQLARTIRRQIMNDIEDGTFDRTKAKYLAMRPQRGFSVTLKSVEAAPFLSVLEQYTAQQLKDGEITELTSGKHEALCNKLRKFNGDCMTEGEANEFITLLRATQKNITLEGNITILKASGNWGVTQGLLAFNPFEKVKKPKIKAKERRATGHYTSSEIAHFMATLDTTSEWSHYRDFCTSLFNNGPRLAEVIGLLWADVYFDADTNGIEICRSLGRSKGKQPRMEKDTKTGSVRLIKFNTVTREVFTRLFNERNPKPTDFVFLSPEGGPIDDANFRNRCWNPVCVAAGLINSKTGKPRHPPKSARHGFGRRLYKAKVDPHSVAYAMGHSSPRTSLEAYGHDSYSPPIPEI
jgi:integrase